MTFRWLCVVKHNSYRSSGRGPFSDTRSAGLHLESDVAAAATAVMQRFSTAASAGSALLVMMEDVTRGLVLSACSC